jgi:hypothetical protein
MLNGIKRVSEGAASNQSRFNANSWRREPGMTQGELDPAVALTALAVPGIVAGKQAPSMGGPP